MALICEASSNLCIVVGGVNLYFDVTRGVLNGMATPALRRLQKLVHKSLLSSQRYAALHSSSHTWKLHAKRCNH